MRITVLSTLLSGKGTSGWKKVCSAGSLSGWTCPGTASCPLSPVIGKSCLDLFLIFCLFFGLSDIFNGLKHIAEASISGSQGHKVAPAFFSLCFFVLRCRDGIAGAHTKMLVEGRLLCLSIISKPYVNVTWQPHGKMQPKASHYNVSYYDKYLCRILNRKLDSI